VENDPSLAPDAMLESEHTSPSDGLPFLQPWRWFREDR
jgi:hypothetical protein